MDVLTDDEKIHRGHRAADLLSSGVFDEALTDIRDGLLAGLENLQTDDPAPVVAIVGQMRSLKYIRSTLETWVQNGRLVRIQRGEKVDG